MSETPHVSVVIVTWNAREVIGDCLDGLAANPPPQPWDAVVVDNGSSDGTVEAARRHPLGVAVIANDRNRGLAAANNQGIAATAGRHVLIANPDTVVGPGAVAALVELLERRPRAAFAVPLLRRPDGRLQTSAGDLPSPAEALAGRQLQARRRAAATSFSWDGWAHDCERRIGRGQEACYLVRRAAIEAIGPQDEGFRLDWEGIDWAARAASGGWELWFTPAAEVVHLGGASIRQAPVRWIVGSHRGMYRYFAKRTTPVLRPALAAVVLLRGLFKAVGSALGPAAYRRWNRD